jgi:hypothetical protein
MYVHGFLEKKPIEMLIDSGANISVVGYRVYDKMNADTRPELQEYVVPTVTADGTPMKVYGYAKFEFCVGQEKESYQHKMCVADVGVDLILGYDFLKKHEAKINLGNDTIDLKEEIAGPAEPPSSATECEVVVVRTITIPAGGEAIAQGKCIGDNLQFIGMLENVERSRSKHCMLIARAVVTVGDKGVPVRMFNLEDKPVTIYKNTMVAKCSMVEVVKEDRKPEVVKERENTTVVPGHLKKLYDEASVELGESDRSVLAELLCEYEEVFSAHGLDMGKTGLIQHAIDTQGAHPIKQKLRRVPIHMKKVVSSEMKKLVERDLIEPSMSPWASSLVIVKKKDLDEKGGP